MADYLTGCGKTWGVLTNGRSWRLMRQGELLAHLRFDLVAWLEDLRGRKATIDDGDRQTFGLFWHLFGPPAVGGDWLDTVCREAAAETRRVRVKHDGKWALDLRNQKGERKASGSYFTPDALVDHAVRSTLGPLLAASGDDPHKVLALKIVDPAMGSGHFLV